MRLVETCLQFDAIIVPTPELKEYICKKYYVRKKIFVIPNSVTLPQLTSKPKEEKAEPKAEEKPAPQQEQQQTASAPTPTPEPKASKSIPELIDSIFSETHMYVMIFLGILIACIGGLIFTFGGGITTIRIGTIINVLGCLIIGLFLLIGGISIKSYEKFVKLGMILGGAIMITWSLSIPA